MTKPRSTYNQVQRDALGTYREVWHCPIPDSDTYRVLDQWWDEDFTVRHIVEVVALEEAHNT